MCQALCIQVLSTLHWITQGGQCFYYIIIPIIQMRSWGPERLINFLLVIQLGSGQAKIWILGISWAYQCLTLSVCLRVCWSHTISSFYLSSCLHSVLYSFHLQNSTVHQWFSKCGHHKVKTIFIIILRYYLPFSLLVSHEYIESRGFWRLHNGW